MNMVAEPVGSAVVGGSGEEGVRGKKELIHTKRCLRDLTG